MIMRIKFIVTLAICTVVIVAAGAAIYFKDRLRLIPSFFERGTEAPLEQTQPTIDLATRAHEAYEYAKAHHMDTDHAILIDFARHSGKDRFFVWNFKTQSPQIKSIVAHGYGNVGFESDNQNIVFSNQPNSYASSLGKYRVGIRAPSKWGIGIHYKLHGLEASNSNAFQRYIVLHSFKMIPNEETFPNYLPLGFSQGCPVVDDDTMRKVDKLLQTKKKPVLLWAYYGE
ncbi:hypothetical protein BMY_1974 [Wohlfahrtiimonas chitiniclastica]|uniref:murein L,D-transpeptidase catalytic domain-containing protein n=1 Tax=Wohlfahrtiimonas chitiniclastica TaxID=400946 RepID=UPI0007B41AEB|nr:hypothetical protein BMY_1974 [Wohlfahrtiimonas chitiniclastica]